MLIGEFVASEVDWLREESSNRRKRADRIQTNPSFPPDSEGGGAPGPLPPPPPLTDRANFRQLPKGDEQGLPVNPERSLKAAGVFVDDGERTG